MIRTGWVLALLLGATAWAADPKVDVQTDVVYAQEKAGPVDPSLTQMQAALAKGKKYGALKLISSKRLTLDAKPTAVPLPSAQAAELSLVKLEAGVATVKVKFPTGETTLKLGREGSLYQQAGKWQGGDMWLVLSQPK